MKRIFLLPLMALLCSLNAEAQVFDHLSAGVGTGTDGTSIELAAPIGSCVQLRLGYGTALGLGYTLKGDKGVWVKVHPDQEGSPEIRVPMKFSLARNDARLLVNLYLSPETLFHFTVGAYLGSGRLMKSVVRDLPAEYNTAGTDLGGHIVKAENNRIAMELRAFGLGSQSFAVMPYAGIGFGRAVREDKLVSFSFDLGATYVGNPSLWARSAGSGGHTELVDVSHNNVMDLQKMIDKYGKVLYFWPVANFHMYFKLF